MRKLVPIVFVLIVVAVECVVAYTYLPTAAQTEALAHSAANDASPAKSAADEKDKAGAEKEKKGEKKEEKGAHGEKGGKGEKGEKAEKGEKGEKKEESKADLIEVDLGQFTVTSVQPGSSTTLRIAFHLYGVVANLDQERFATRLKESQHRLREQVILAIRGAEMSDLTEPGLGLLKRTILEKTNTTLGEHLLKAIVVSEFSFMEV